VALNDLLRFGTRRADAPAAPARAEASEDVVPSKAFARFLGGLAGREMPVILDLGPVVGSNVTFFGERLGCKIFVEDLFADLERHARGGRLDDLAAFFATRLPQAAASVDGVLCWDFFDYLPRAAAQTLARALVRTIQPGGGLFGFFGTAPIETRQYTRFVVVDEQHLRHRPYPASRFQRQVFQNRDIMKMFEGLIVSDSFLLKSNTREILFRRT
jgi:hypothetical protein